MGELSIVKCSDSSGYNYDPALGVLSKVESILLFSFSISALAFSIGSESVRVWSESARLRLSGLLSLGWTFRGELADMWP